MFYHSRGIDEYQTIIMFPEAAGVKDSPCWLHYSTTIILSNPEDRAIRERRTVALVMSTNTAGLLLSYIPITMNRNFMRSLHDDQTLGDAHASILQQVESLGVPGLQRYLTGCLYCSFDPSRLLLPIGQGGLVCFVAN
jgi:hypothetical protein